MTELHRPSATQSCLALKLAAIISTEGPHSNSRPVREPTTMGLMRRVRTAAHMFVDGIRRFARGRLLPPAADGKLGFVGHEYDARFEAFARERGRTVPQIALFLAGATGVQAILAGMSTKGISMSANSRAIMTP
jgi:hypothetical protein